MHVTLYSGYCLSVFCGVSEILNFGLNEKSQHKAYHKPGMIETVVEGPRTVPSTTVKAEVS